MPSPSISIDDASEQNPHYVQAVTEMGEEQIVVAEADIYAANGMKLLAKGARINRSQCERLTLHKLRLPLDQMLSAERSVDAALLASDANRMFADDPAMTRLAARSGDPQGFRQGLGMLVLPPPLAFRMTVMREKRPDLYAHSMRVALITYSMAVRLKMSRQDKQDLLLAGLCHDVGEMHTDPLLLVATHHIRNDERRFIHAHPVTGFVILRDIPGLPAAVAKTVLHHHERLDGSGYPSGLLEPDIHPLAKLLCVAEVMEGVLRRADIQRLEVLFRMNQRRFDAKAVETIRDLLQTATTDAEVSRMDVDNAKQLGHVIEVLAHWPSISSSLDGEVTESSAMRFLTERMTMLRSLVLQSGIDPNDQGVLLELARENADVFNELQSTLGELQWLMIDISNEIERRATDVDDENKLILSRFVNLLRSC